MILVADTTPLRYLIFINEEQVLSQMFGTVYVAPEVLRVELQRKKTPPLFRLWAESPPAWLIGSSSKPQLGLTRRYRRGFTSARPRQSPSAPPRDVDLEGRRLGHGQQLVEHLGCGRFPFVQRGSQGAGGFRPRHDGPS
jgi:hypothetical protein